MNAIAALSDLKAHRLTVDEVILLKEQGAFDHLPRMELLDGVLYEMSPQYSRHVLARNRLTFRLQNAILALGLPYEALSEPTIAISPVMCPEPDIIICTNPVADRFYAPEAVLLAVEVSFSTLATDLDFKRKLYAGAAIGEYWVVAGETGIIHQYWDPKDGDYAMRASIVIGDDVVMATLPALAVATDALF
jgi:Uma2 family endonuclease